MMAPFAPRSLLIRSSFAQRPGKLFPNPQSSLQSGNSGDQTSRELWYRRGTLNPNVSE